MVPQMFSYVKIVQIVNVNMCSLLYVNYISKKLYIKNRDFPGGAVVKNLPANAEDMGSSPGPGRSHMPRSN